MPAQEQYFVCVAKITRDDKSRNVTDKYTDYDTNKTYNETRWVSNVVETVMFAVYDINDILKEKMKEAASEMGAAHALTFNRELLWRLRELFGLPLGDGDALIEGIQTAEMADRIAFADFEFTPRDVQPIAQAEYTRQNGQWQAGVPVWIKSLDLTPRESACVASGYTSFTGKSFNLEYREARFSNDIVSFSRNFFAAVKETYVKKRFGVMPEPYKTYELRGAETNQNLAAMPAPVRWFFQEHNREAFGRYFEDQLGAPAKQLPPSQLATEREGGLQHNPFAGLGDKLKKK